MTDKFWSTITKENLKYINFWQIVKTAMRRIEEEKDHKMKELEKEQEKGGGRIEEKSWIMLKLV